MIPKSRVMQHALIPRQIEQMYRQDPLFTPVFVLPYIDIWIFLFSFYNKVLYWLWGEAHLLCDTFENIDFVYIFGF